VGYRQGGVLLKTGMFLAIFVSIVIVVAPCSYSQGVLPPPVFQAYNSPENAGREPAGENDIVTLSADSLWTAPLYTIKPTTSMYHSLVVPGWGQIDNGKKKKAALFFIAEMVCIGGYLYYNHEIRHGEYTGWEKDNLRTDRNTFILYWMVSKIFGIMDAYVDAQFANYDITDITPDDLKKK